MEPGQEKVDVRAPLQRLFEAAQERDEFEFCCTLLRVRGMESAGWDPFDETHQLVSDLVALLNSPFGPHTRARLALLLYSHLTEVGSVYDLLANLLDVAEGDRYSMEPFRPLQSRRGKSASFVPTPVKVDYLRTRLEKAGHDDVSQLIDAYFNSSVRNAFAHADYGLHQGEFRSRNERFLVDGILTSALPLPHLFSLIDRALQFLRRVH